MHHSNTKRLYLNLGLEADDVPLDPALDVEPQDMEASEAIEGETELQELNENAAQLKEFSEVTEGTGELEVAVESAIASGKGLSRIEATALNLALQATMGKYVRVESNIVPARESYAPSTIINGKAETPTSNAEETKAAKNGIVAGIKAFIAAIIKKVKSIIHNAKIFFKRIGDRFSVTMTKLHKITNRLEKGESFGTFKTKFNISNIHIGGEFETDNFVDGLMKLSEVVRTLSDYDDKTRTEEEKAFLKEGIEAIKASDLSDWDKVRYSLRAYMATSFSSIFEGKVGKDTKEKVTSEPFMGGRRFFFNPGEESGMNQLPSMSMKIVDKMEGELEKEIVLPDSATLSGIMKVSFGIMNALNAKNRGTSMFFDLLRSVEEDLGRLNVSENAKLANNKAQIGSISSYLSQSSQFRSNFFWLAIDAIAATIKIAEHAIKLADADKAGAKTEEKTA